MVSTIENLLLNVPRVSVLDLAIVSRVAQNLEILKKLPSLGGFIFHLGHIKIKKNIFGKFYLFLPKRESNPGRLTFPKFPNAKNSKASSLNIT